MRCSKKQIRPQLPKYPFQNESALGHKLWKAADSFWNQYFENCGRICFFLTPHNFANGPHFITLTQLRATKIGSKICCTHLSYTLSESWVRKDSVGTCPEKISCWTFSVTVRFTKKFLFSQISLSDTFIAVYKIVTIIQFLQLCNNDTMKSCWSVKAQI